MKGGVDKNNHPEKNSCSPICNKLLCWKFPTFDSLFLIKENNAMHLNIVIALLGVGGGGGGKFVEN